MNIARENARKLRNMRKNFRTLRRERKLTINELAKLSGISVRILKDIEHGRDFDIGYIFRLCGFYAIEPRGIFSPHVPPQKREPGIKNSAPAQRRLCFVGASARSAPAL